MQQLFWNVAAVGGKFLAILSAGQPSSVANCLRAANLPSSPRSLRASVGLLKALGLAGFGKAKLTRREGKCGAVTLIQRFGGALNLNVRP